MDMTTKVFTGEEGQAVVIPAPFRLDCDEVYVKLDSLTGDLILSQKKQSKKEGWEEFFKLRDEINVPEDFMIERYNPIEDSKDVF